MGDLTSFENLFETPEGEMILKKRMAELLKALTLDFPTQGGQTALADEIGIKQSALSGYLNPEKKDSRMTSKDTDALIVKYLKKTKSSKWSLQELYNFLESGDSFETFSAKLERQNLSKENLTAKNLVDFLSPEEQVEAVQYIFNRLKETVSNVRKVVGNA
ncbi:hypothetical protein [Pseudanabaena sp. Chao 1811]|uniref:hypothetical protein n=1 Tax=Pseudanabaena sp. Chao 1811 TaxID=2963092 RepID=UPI0022F39954|nr:hypothetical protein [Pseudanabaena sp. Chao 1811]